MDLTKLYTQTGDATDGTMTQKAITEAIEEADLTGHTGPTGLTVKFAVV